VTFDLYIWQVVQLGPIKVKFEGWGQRSKFVVTGWKCSIFGYRWTSRVTRWCSLWMHVTTT